MRESNIPKGFSGYSTVLEFEKAENLYNKSTINIAVTQDKRLHVTSQVERTLRRLTKGYSGINNGSTPHSKRVSFGEQP